MPSKKLNLRDHLEDNALDLSMADLEEVPVRDIAQIKKATSLDLSSNRLIILKDNFATLTHLTKLDLSKNQLTSLPENFGELIYLKSLDLYRNKLTHLPLSLGQLKVLRWLDLKDNPLVPVLAEVAGPCLDRTQCQQCARKIVLFLQDMQEKVEIRKQEIIEKGRKEQEVAQKKEEAKKKKKLAKAEKKKENGVKNTQPVNTVNVDENKGAKKANANAKSNNHQAPQPVHEKKEEIKHVKGGSSSRKIIKFLFYSTIFSLMSLVLLHSICKEKYDILTHAVAETWDSFVLVLPPQVVSTGRQVTDVAQPTVKLVWGHILDVGNQVVVKVQEGYSWLKANEQSQQLFRHAESMWDVVCDGAGEIYRTVTRVTLITVENVKKKVF